MGVFRHIKKLDVENITKKGTRLHIWLRDMKTSKEGLVPFEGNNQEELYQLLRCAVSMPYLSPGSGMYRGSRYKDGMRYREEFLPSVIREAKATDILVLYNRPDQKICNIINDAMLEVFPEEPIGWMQTKPEEVFAAARRMEAQVRRIFKE
jgi:hypothetical protein